jgi:hypothetical protein
MLSLEAQSYTDDERFPKPRSGFVAQLPPNDMIRGQPARGRYQQWVLK